MNTDGLQQGAGKKNQEQECQNKPVKHLGPTHPRPSISCQSTFELFLCPGMGEEVCFSMVQTLT